jgi:hypothetical protein
MRNVGDWKIAIISRIRHGYNPASVRQQILHSSADRRFAADGLVSGVPALVRHRHFDPLSCGHSISL